MMFKNILLTVIAMTITVSVMILWALLSYMRLK
jgi:hypothetical protein